jgi:4-hydroxy-4-methyl-2-oxoglutarate aldolase
MRTLSMLILCAVVCLVSLVSSQEKSKADLEKGFNFLETRVYSDADNARVLKLYEGLRVADVSDGMDMAGLPGIGLVDPAIHPDWIDQQDLSHQFRGLALTARYVPTQRPDRPKPG